MNLPLQRKLIARFGSAFLIMGIAVALVYRNSQRRIEADSLVAHTLQVLNDLERTANLAVDLESGMRGYVITGREDYLEPYLEARVRLPEELKRLRQMTADNASQQSRLSALERLITDQLTFRASVVRSVKEQGLEAGWRLVATRQGKKGMDAIRHLIGEMEAEEQRLLERRQQTSASADRTAVWGLVGLGGLIAMILLGAYFQVRQHLGERLRAEEALREREENLAVTLHSIGDGVLATDAEGRVTRLNPVAERLTGWTQAEARGRPVDEVFRIINEKTRQPAVVPVEKVLATGLMTGLANHSVLVARDGAECPVADSAAPIRGPEGKLLGVVLVFRDVTAERQAEQALRASEERYRQVTETAPFALSIQCEGRFAYMNAAGLAMFGANQAEDMVGKPVLDFAHPDSRESVQERLRRLNVQGVPAPPREVRLLRLDGSAFWAEGAANPTTYQGKPGAIVIHQDISRRKRVEEELRRIEWLLGEGERRPDQRLAGVQPYGDLSGLNRSRVVLDATGHDVLAGIMGDYLDLLETSAAVYEKNGDYALGIFTSGWCRFMDHASRQLCGDVDNQQALASGKWLCHESCWTRASKVAVDTGQPADIECDGGIRLYAVPIRAAGEIVGSINFGYGDPPRDPDKQRELAAKYGVSLDELRGHARAYQTRPAYIIEQAKRRLRSSAQLIGEIIARKRAEEELGRLNAELEQRVVERTAEVREAEIRYRALFEESPAGVLVIDPETLLPVEFNETTCRQLGYSRQEFAQLRVGDYEALEGPADTRARTERVLSEGRADFETQHRTKTGEIRHVQVVVKKTELGGKPVLHCVFRDITERKQLEEQCQQARKMEAIGRLAGGVAHDFNNLLTVINGYGDLLLGKLDARDPMYERLTEIRKAGERAAELTQQLLAFSRRQIVQPKVLDLNQVVRDVEKLLRRVLGEDIELMTVLDPELGRLKADAGQITQVLMNLAVNARDAMPDGGHLLIETANVDLSQRYAKEHLEIDPGAYVRITVSDSGIGMDPATQARIFDPFFTTKKSGEGTGLGLSTVHGIVKQAGGSIYVYSEVGQGTTFKIYFPRVDETQPVEEAKPGVGTLRGRETILVVEDQAELRKLAELVLKSYGYKVLESGNAGEALLKAERHSGPIHLLLTDVVLPGMSGRELAERLKPLRPDMRVLYMSGYTENVIAHRGTLEEGIEYLAKPFAPEGLARKVREVLGPERSAGTILVVDDEAGIRSLLRQVLQGAGYVVLEAEDGKKAMAQAAAVDLDLVITDLAMPDQEGLETIQLLHEQKPGLKIIAMSGAFRGELLGVAEKLGAQATLAKPIRPDHLLKTVREVLTEA